MQTQATDTSSGHSLPGVRGMPMEEGQPEKWTGMGHQCITTAFNTSNTSLITHIEAKGHGHGLGATVMDTSRKDDKCFQLGYMHF